MPIKAEIVVYTVFIKNQTARLIELRIRPEFITASHDYSHSWNNAFCILFYKKTALNKPGCKNPYSI